MRLSDIDLNLLVAFEAIYREQNLTRAAEKLNLTQPALSHALARLRDLFQDPLFARTARLMAPTPFARSIISPVRDALSTLERGLFQNRSFDPAHESRRFVVGLRDALESAWLPRLIEHFYVRAPKLSLVSTRVVRAELETELSSGAIDLAIEIVVPVSSAIRHQPIAEDKLVVVARRGRASEELSLARYLEATHVLVSSRRRGPGLEDVALRQAGLKRNIALRCQNYHAASRVVQNTELLLTMPERLARALHQEADAVILPFPIEMQPLTMHMYWWGASDNDPANRWLREEVMRLSQTL